ncbi:fumarate/nitrate reduction transcriptional regulator Fnr [Pelomicrobium sp. G1]|uniref:fumarate/nitrate reduction transcriptional regulator Fnr n=1 Tax=unclassified Pelomicrobium TaxID=2815318 RepID=UPI003F764CAD
MAAPPPVKGISLTALRTACSACNLQELCLPIGLTREEVERLDAVVYRRRRVKRGEHLYRAGEGFDALFAVRSGFFKTYLLSEDGREQVTGFHMMGEVMGLDAISSDRHPCSAVALEDSETCEVPFSELETLSREMPSLQRHLHKMMSREIVRDQGVMLLLGSMKAEERLAAFLVNLSQRFQARGYSPSAFNLRMTREEIGSYLGLKLETVSRLFSKFQQERLIRVHNKAIQILDPAGLNAFIGPCVLR